MQQDVCASVIVRFFHCFAIEKAALTESYVSRLHLSTAEETDLLIFHKLLRRAMHI